MTHFIVNGIEVPYGETDVATKRSNTGRTRFFETAAILGLKPKRIGNRNLWTVEQADAIREYRIRQSEAKRGDAA